MSSKAFQRTLHRQLWKWLSLHPEKDKEDWVGWEWNGGTVDAVSCECFACDYDDMLSMDCSDCPLDFPLNREGKPKCSNGGLWRQWEKAKDPQERTRLALAIMDLPVRDGVVWE